MPNFDNYTYLEVNDLTKAITFFKNKMGMVGEFINSSSKSNRKSFLAYSDRFNGIILSETQLSPKVTKVIFKTSDCLESVHDLKSRGIIFQHEPKYESFGLCAAFYDPFGNEIFLVEERNYTTEFVAEHLETTL
jgi:predicted enzyme related to lactoylglutathione lyase